MNSMPERDQTTPGKSKRSRRVSPELTEFLHMLDSLEGKSSPPESGQS
jgi:hypothetical protein